MKILLVSMPSIHVIRWIENLQNENIAVYWFDVLGKGQLNVESNVSQIINWKKRKFPYIKGEHWISRKIPIFYKKILPFLEVTPDEALRKSILKIKPDIIHSFEMQSCSYAILKTMCEFSNIKWIYSCWGSDLFYYTKLSSHRNKINKVLNRVNYLITDCNRDYELAKINGFKGVFLGIIPGGTGFKLNELKNKQLLIDRKIILVKGYEHKFGRALNVLKALHQLHEELQDYEIVIFGAHPSVFQYVKDNNLPFTLFDRHGLKHNELLNIMGKSLLYIGNSVSDGIPNTLLEAMVMGVFPIQSNPGNVTAEIIDNQVNGLLINNPNDIDEIMYHIRYAINNMQIMDNAIVINQIYANKKLDYFINQQKIINSYRIIYNSSLV